MFVWNDDRPVAAEGGGRRTGSARAIREQAAARRQPRCLPGAARRRWSAASAPCCGSCPARPRCRIFWSTFRRPAWPPACRKNCFSPAARRATASTRNCRSRSNWWARYHDFGSFVSGIAALPRIVTLHDIQITPVDAKSGYDNLTMDVTAKTYRYIEDEGGAQPRRRRDGGRQRRETDIAQRGRHRRRARRHWSRPAVPAANRICRSGSPTPRKSPAAAFSRCRK